MLQKYGDSNYIKREKFILYNDCRVLIKSKIMQATKYIFLPICLLLATGVFAQTAPAIQWQKCLGGIYDDQGLSFQQTADGGYIIAGTSISNDGDVSGNHINQYNTAGSYDYWIVKLGASQNIQWQKSLGGSNTEVAWSVQQTADGGYVVAGYSDSNDGDVTGWHGFAYDDWIVKLDASGNIQWQKILGGTNGDNAFSLQQTADGGYIVAGGSSSNDGDVSGNHPDAFHDNSNDAWVVKLDASGNIQWQKSLGGSGNDNAQSICQTVDGGYIVAGYSTSDDGDVSGNHNNINDAVGDAWVVKLEASGNIVWQKCLGGSANDFAKSIRQTADGGYIVAGGTTSNDGDVSNYHGAYANVGDAWVVKLDASGNIQWQKCLGGTYDEVANSIQQTADGGFIVAGFSNSNDGDVSGRHGYYNDAWVVKLTITGEMEWQKCLGGTYDEGASSIQQTADGGYIVAGSSDSNNDGDVSGNHGYPFGTSDYWIVKLDADIALPLRLLSFTGILENNATKLNWQSTNEINTKDFIVERSANAINFSAIGKVNAQTSSAITHSYHYTDNAPLPGTSFYRLKMEDKDDRFTYSSVIRINQEVRSEINITPNPVSNYTTISFKLLQKQKILISIYDMAGRMVKILANAELQAGTHERSWDTKDEKGNAVSAGIYFLKIQSVNYSETRKLVVVK